MQIEQIKQLIQLSLPEAEVEIFDPMNDGVHLKASVAYAGFAGKSLLEQHRMVMNALKNEFQGDLHALALETKVKTRAN